jgi:hypothetical protein
MRIQRPIKGQVREPLGSSSLKIIREYVEDAADEFKCSKSLVVNTALAHFFGIKNHELYYENPNKKRKIMIVKR